MSCRLFITGTGTDVGKTYITGLILKKLQETGQRNAYYKVAMSGNIVDETGKLIPGDAITVQKMSGIIQPLSEMCHYIYEHGVSPHLAARLEGNPVEMKQVAADMATLSANYDYLTVEGSGGIVCPLRCDEEAKIYSIDIIQAFSLPCLIVADAGLGTINQVVLTVHYLHSLGAKVKGIIFNCFDDNSLMHRDNRNLCEKITKIPVVASVAKNATDLPMTLDKLLALYE